MGVQSYETEVSSHIAPHKVFKAFVVDCDTLLPKVVPQAIKSCETIEGDGGPGTIKKFTFVEGIAGSKYGYLKQKYNVVDKEKLHFSYTIFEGEGIGEKIEKIEKEVKVEAREDGGCTIKTCNKYYTVGDYKLTEEEIEGIKQKGSDFFKAFETYFLAHPDHC